MLRITVILFFIVFQSSCSAYSQKGLTYSKVDSIVASINNAKQFLNVLDTGHLKQDEIKGRYRDSYIIDTSTNELRAFISSTMLDVTRNSTFTAYYFYNSRLIKVETGDVYGGYKKHNLTHLYYFNESKEKADTFQSKELKKLKYLRLSTQYLTNYKTGKLHR